MRKLVLTILGASLTIAQPVMAETKAPEAKPAAANVAYSTATTKIGALIANPAAKAIVDKHVPGFSDNPSLEMAAEMTLRDIQPMAGDKLTDEILAAIDADLKALPAPAK